MGRHVIAGGSQVVLHVAAAQEAARINVLKAREDILRGLAHDVDHYVQPPAMAHAQHHLLRAQGRGAESNTSSITGIKATMPSSEKRLVPM